MSGRTPKGERMFQRLVEAATRSFSLFGDRGTTFQSIADLSGVSQPLVAKYFKKRENVFPAAVENWLQLARQDTARAVSAAFSPREQLREYIRVSVEIFRTRPDTAKVYLLLHYHAGFDEKFRQQNTGIKKVAVERIAGILQEGIRTGAFRSCDVPLVAKSIHCSLVGLALSLPCEDLTFTDRQLQAALENMVFSYLDPAPRQSS